MKGVYIKLGKRMMPWVRYGMALERGLAKHRKMYHLFRMFDYRSYMRHGIEPKNKETTDQSMVYKFLSKYPDASHNFLEEYSKITTAQFSPAARFVKLQKKFMNNGYTEERAFEIAEEQMAEVLRKNVIENRAIKAEAHLQGAKSYFSLFENESHFEAHQKVMRIRRDMPKYLRERAKWVSGLQERTLDEVAEIIQNEEDESFYEKNLLRGYYSIKPNDYKPASYSIITSGIGEEYKKKSELQQEFLDDTQRLLRVHQERASLCDGLSPLSDREIIFKMRESPTKIKRRMKKLITKLDSLGVFLDESGNLDLSCVQTAKDVKDIKQNESLVKLALMERDLNFEYPHKMAKILPPIERPIPDNAPNDLPMTYENYYNIHPDNNVLNPTQGETGGYIWSSNSKHTMTFEEYKTKISSPLLFENDLIDISYQFWESVEDRAKRLEELWKNVKSDKASDEASIEFMQKRMEDLVDKIRIARWKLDQTLEDNDIDPIFKDNYMHYTREEFLADAKISFNKIKSLMDRDVLEFEEVRNLKRIICEETTRGYYDSRDLHHKIIKEQFEETDSQEYDSKVEVEMQEQDEEEFNQFMEMEQAQDEQEESKKGPPSKLHLLTELKEMLQENVKEEKKENAGLKYSTRYTRKERSDYKRRQRAELIKPNKEI